MNQIDWIAIFKNDLTSKVFTEPVKSGNVIYWIKRFEDGRYHRPTTTNNKYALRSFDIFDANFKLAHLQCDNGDWKCLTFKEHSLDYWGSSCSCIIEDKHNVQLKVSVHGKYPRSNFNNNASISADLYPISLLFFLKLLSNYECWESLRIENKRLMQEITKGVPRRIFRQVDRREIFLTNCAYG